MNSRRSLRLAPIALFVIGIACQQFDQQMDLIDDILPPDRPIDHEIENTCSPNVGIRQGGVVASGEPAPDQTFDIAAPVLYQNRISNTAGGTAKNVVVYLDWYDGDEMSYINRVPCSLSPSNRLGPRAIADVSCVASRSVVDYEIDDDTDSPVATFPEPRYIPRYSIHCDSYEWEETEAAQPSDLPAESEETEAAQPSDLPAGDLSFSCTPVKGYLIRLLEPDSNSSTHTVDSAEHSYTVVVSLASESIDVVYSSDILITWPMRYQDSVTREYYYTYHQQRHERSGGSTESKLLADNWFTLTTEDVTIVSSNESGDWEANPPAVNTRHLIGYFDLDNGELLLCDNWSTVPDVAAFMQGGPAAFESNCPVDLYTCRLQ